jgi:hypothetical protein
MIDDMPLKQLPAGELGRMASELISAFREASE